MEECKFIPGGRVLRNAGRPRGSLLNCYALPIGDSIEEIGSCCSESLILWSEGGGVGIPFSTLRPAGSAINGKGGESSGLVSFMSAIDGLAATIESGGGRRAASLGSCDVSHPEIEKFIDAKVKDGAIKYLNISVNVTHEFLKAVLDGINWELKFRGLGHKIISAPLLWKKIVDNMLLNGEPGILVWDNLVKNNSYYFAPIISTNPCGEAPLAAYDGCDLGSIVLPAFVDNSGRTKWGEMEKTINAAVAFLDNVIDVNRYALEKNKHMCQQGRRVGLGVMGLAEYLFKKEIKYGSRDSISAVDNLCRFMRDCVYNSSIKLSKERGSFPAFNSTLYHSASFVRKLPAWIRKDIRQYGIRNVTLLAFAPTGTISLIPEVTPGIEPLFSKAYRRTDRANAIYIHPMFEKHGCEDWFVDSKDLSVEDHLNMQVTCQKYVDGAVSKTINIPSDFKSNELSDILLEYLFDLKGVTIYRDGSRKMQPLQHLNLEEATGLMSTEISKESIECSKGVCEL
jgi:ribonucleoside-diphosphate reductase alpha chain